MLKQNVIFTRGLVASGKTSWALKFIEENQDYKRVNRDSIRQMLSNYTFDDDNEKLVSVIEKETIDNILFNGYNLVIDNMNLNKRTNKELISFITDKYDVEILYIDFPITLSEAIERDSKREFPIGKRVIKSIYNKYEIELKQMVERTKPIYSENIDLPSCIICDLDGTLSNSVNRKIFDGKNIDKDIVIEPVRRLLYDIKCKIFIFSGRSDEWKEQTIKWLKDNYIKYDELYMRKNGDNRCDTIVKSEIFEEHIRSKYYCKFVIDDRIKVLDMWVNKGLFVFNVNQDPYAKNQF